MFKRFVWAFIALSSLGSLYASKEVGCRCNDGTVKVPECGICGESTGWMDQSATGAICYCESGLKSSEISCEDVCKNHGGWSGDFR